jgi:hypothetical protein
VAFELRLTGAVPRQRLVAAVVLLTFAPLGTVLPVLATGTIAYAVLAVVATLETRARLWGRPEGVGRPGWPRPQISLEAARPSRRRRSRTSEPRALTRD